MTVEQRIAELKKWIEDAERMDADGFHGFMTVVRKGSIARWEKQLERLQKRLNGP